MESMTRPPQPQRPAPPYRPPVARGQTYPPLGFADDGTPRFQYRPPNAAAELPVDPPPPPPEAPGQGAPGPGGPGRDPVWRTMAGIAAVIVLVLVVAGALKLLSSRGDDNQFAQRSDPPPVSQPLDDPYLDDTEDPLPSESPTRRPAPPPRSTPRSQGPAQETVYEAVTEGRATVLFLTDGRTQVTSISGGTWTKDAVTNGMARLTVLVTEGQKASCRITVEGEVVAERELDASSPLRLLTCQG